MNTLLFKNIIKIIAWILMILVGVVTIFLSFFIPKKREILIWGPTPIINNKYWSSALKEIGYKSQTVMQSFYSINRKNDFDLTYDDLLPKWMTPFKFLKIVKPFLAYLYFIRVASVIHVPFSGGPLGSTPLWRFEALLMRFFKIKTIVLPYGADAFQYSKVIDPSLLNGLLISYPEAARKESLISKRIQYWQKHADIILTGLLIDGMGRWDCPINNMLCIDVKEWIPRKKYSNNNGKNGTVKIMHSPNHRGGKGTEFIIHAVNELINEGLKIELILLEKVSNFEVRNKMQTVDIIADQLLVGYGLNAIEGMASGLVVLSNINNEVYTRIFRRYAFLNECPIISSTPETIKQDLKILIENPKLRQTLGRAGRKYVEKYHSYTTAQYLFGSIYDKILNNKDVDLMNLFHPILSDYNKKLPYVQHPLLNSKLGQK